MILRGVSLHEVSYYAESNNQISGEISAQYDTAGSHSILHGVNSHFLKLLHMALKGSVIKISIDSYFNNKGLNFSFLQQSHRMTFLFDSAQYDTAWSQFFRF